MLLSLLIIVIVGIFAIFALNKIEKITREDSVAALKIVLDTTHEALNLWMKDYLNEISSISSSGEFISETKELLKITRNKKSLIKSKPLSNIRDYVRLRLQSRGDLGIFIISPDFISVASMRDENLGSVNFLAQNRKNQIDNVFQGKIEIIKPLESDVQLTDVGGNLIPEAPTMFFASPIIDHDREVIAIFTIRIDPERDFTRIARIGRIGESGETYFFDAKGVLITESRFTDQLRSIGLLGRSESSVLNIHLKDPGGSIPDGFKPLVSLQEQPFTRMASSALNGEFGTDENGYRDYRGVRVLGAWLWDKKLKLGITTEISESEALEPYYAARFIIIGLLGLTLLLTFLFYTLIAYLRYHHEKALHESEILKEHEKLEMVQKLAGAVAHEFNQPLQVLKMISEVVEKKMTDNLEEIVEQIPHEVDRISNLIQKLGNIISLRTKSYAAGNKILDFEEPTDSSDRN